MKKLILTFILGLLVMGLQAQLVYTKSTNQLELKLLDSKLLLYGATSGHITLKAPAVAGTGTVYLPMSVGILPVQRAADYSAALTDGVPTDTELDTMIDETPASRGRGWFAIVKDTNGTSLYYIVMSNGTNWFTWPINIAP